MTLKYLTICLRLEKFNKDVEKKNKESSTIMEGNIIKTGLISSIKRKKSFGPKNYLSKKKFNGHCHNYRKARHKLVECRARKMKKDKG